MTTPPSGHSQRQRSERFYFTPGREKQHQELARHRRQPGQLSKGPGPGRREGAARRKVLLGQRHQSLVTPQYDAGRAAGWPRGSPSTSASHW